MFFLLLKSKGLQEAEVPCSVLGVGLEPTQPQWPRDFKSLVSTDSTIRAAGLVGKNAPDKFCGAKLIAFFGFCKKKMIFDDFWCDLSFLVLLVLFVEGVACYYII